MGASLTMIDRLDDGYFGNASIVRRIWRESIVLLGGVPRMLLMEAAHPLVAAGINGHSQYRDNPWRRLAGTVRAYSTLVFGARAEADRAASAIRLRHSAIKGRIERRMGTYPAGTAYAADDPKLLMWVHAACVDTGLVMYRTFVRRIPSSAEEQFYEEMKVIASMLGVPAACMPLTLADFYGYLERRMASDVYVTDAAREIAALVLDPPVPVALRPVTATLRSLTIAMLPDQIRTSYGLQGWPAARTILAASAPPVRQVLMPLLPRRTRLLWGEKSAFGPGGLAIEVVNLLASTTESRRTQR